VGGNKKLYHKLLLQFHEEYQEPTARIREAFDASDRELAQRLAHTGKGVAGNIGALELFQAGAGLEGAIKNGAGEINDLLGAFDQALRTVLDSLALLAKPKPEAVAGPEAETVDPAVLKAFLEKLTPVIQKRNPKPIKDMLAESAGMNWPDDFRAEMSQLEKLVNKYKYKEAAELLAGLNQRLET
ncbi:MAG: Hpt domain-containing protein, partial [Deltaproteobacteria bacterium]|nr:Hpt domain-containing protein [Deltaproteobacteria bacterium]